MFEIAKTGQFKKDFKLIVKRNYDITKLAKVLNLLITGYPLPKEYDEHPLHGNYKYHYDCHIEPDWLLIYKKDEKTELITLVRTGTHSDLFK